MTKLKEGYNQIRVVLKQETYKRLKHQAIDYNLHLNNYVGLLLSGFVIRKREKGKE